MYVLRIVMRFYLLTFFWQTDRQTYIVVHRKVMLPNRASCNLFCTDYTHFLNLKGLKFTQINGKDFEKWKKNRRLCQILLLRPFRNTPCLFKKKQLSLYNFQSVSFYTIPHNIPGKKWFNRRKTVSFSLNLVSAELRVW